MKVITNEVVIKTEYFSQQEYSTGKVLYFDIETTGLRASNSMVYLIGGLYYKDEDEKFETTQWFADNAIDEEKIIKAFLAFSRNFDTVITYNGDTFDIPFLKKRCDYLEIECGKWPQTLDIYKKIRKISKYLEVENIKLKTIERMVGFERKDRYSGKELIELYRTFLLERKNEQYEELLLHNSCDICGLAEVSSLLKVVDIFDGKIAFAELLDETETLKVVYEFDKSILFEKNLDKIIGVPGVTFDKNNIIVHIPVFEGELKYYFENYKDYYYLIYEDMAIHKSVAEFVDKSSRVKATKKNCYVRKSGRFIKIQSKTEAFKLYMSDENEMYLSVDEIVGKDRDELKDVFRDIFVQYF